MQINLINPFRTVGRLQLTFQSPNSIINPVYVTLARYDLGCDQKYNLLAYSSKVISSYKG